METAMERYSRLRPTKSCMEKVSLLERSKPKIKVLSTKIGGLFMFSDIGELRARKKFFYLSRRVLEIDFQTHVFGYTNTRVWIFSLPGFKGHPCDPNEATQLVNYLMHY